MKPYVILFLFLVLLTGCSNSEDEYDNLTTSFQGIVLDSKTNEPFSGGQIEVIGSEGLDFVYRKFFPIAPDGTFDIRVTTDNISLFQLNIEGSYKSCSGPSISQYCTLMSAGEDHKDITILATQSDLN
jgi:hypothetical protein